MLSVAGVLTLFTSEALVKVSSYIVAAATGTAAGVGSLLPTFGGGCRRLG